MRRSSRKADKYTPLLPFDQGASLPSVDQEAEKIFNSAHSCAQKVYGSLGSDVIKDGKREMRGYIVFKKKLLAIVSDQSGFVMPDVDSLTGFCDEVRGQRDQATESKRQTIKIRDRDKRATEREKFNVQESSWQTTLNLSNQLLALSRQYHQLVTK